MKYTYYSNFSFSVSWNIENFNMCPLNYQQKICTPSFVVGALGGTKWRLILYPKGFSYPDYMSIYLLREPCYRKYEKIVVDLEFTVKGTHVEREKNLYNVCFKEGNYHGVSKMLRIRYRNNRYIFSCKQITLICRITSKDDISSHNSPDSLLLSNHLLLLFKSAYLADIVIYCRKQKFLAHTAILIARCPKLHENLNFLNHARFPQRAVIAIFKISVFRNLLKYIYTGRIPVPLHNLRVKLYEAARLLEMRDLIETMDSLPDVSSIKTTFSTEQCTFTWTVTKSHLIRQESLIRILHFNTMYFQDLIMTLRINATPENIQDNISVNFSLNNFNVNRPVFLWYKIFLKDTQENRLMCIHRKDAFENDGTWLGNKSFDFERIPDVFILDCQIEVSDETCISQFETTIDDTSSDLTLDSRYCYNTIQLSKDMNRLFEYGKLSDTAIRCKGKTFAVHRAILEVRSAFFRKLFEQFKIINGRLTINYLSPHLLRLSIVYAYTGTVQIQKRKDWIDLHRFAIAMDMEALKRKCVSCLYYETKLTPVHKNFGGCKT